MLKSIKDENPYAYEYHRPQIKSQLMQDLPDSVTGSMIDDFLDGMVSPLAEILANRDKEQIQRDIREALSTNLDSWKIGKALEGQYWCIRQLAKETCDKQFSKYLSDKRQQLQKQLNQCERLGKEFTELRLGTNEKEISLLGQCLWVPANVNHQQSLANNHSRFVYGGVSVQPNIVRTNQMIRNSNQGTLSGRQLNAASGNAGRGAAGGGGANGGGSGGGPGGNGRFTMIVNNGSRTDVKNVLNQGNHSLTDAQQRKIKRTLNKLGDNHTISVKHMNNGEVRVFGERPGHTSGYQRMSFGIDVSGERTRIVQTAFDGQGNLVRQNPGQAKNNLYDVKFPV